MSLSLRPFLGALALIGAALVLPVSPVTAQYCESLLGPFQRGYSDREISRLADLPVHHVRNCRRELQKPIRVGPDGYPPVNAPGAPPRGAAGPAPGNPAGRPPVGAAGGAPVGRQIQRVP